ncbi:MAG TPA: hypothetical protein VGZ50_03865 [Actinomycetota bacterium]|nr:hypothetical protein [Actinomycetota bacterium]
MTRRDAVEALRWRARDRERASDDRTNGSRSPYPRADSWEELRREITRSRRFGHEFVLVRIPVEDPESWRTTDVAASVFADVLSAVRTIDRVWLHDNALYLLLPESSREGSEAVIARLRREAPDALPDRGVAVAAFPADGLTSGGLLSVLRAPLPARKVIEAEHPTRVDTPLLHASSQ